MEQEIARLQDKHDKQSEKISAVQSDIAALDVQAEQLKMSMNAVESKLQNISHTYGAYQRELEILQDSLKSLLAKIEVLDKETKLEFKDVQMEIVAMKTEYKWWNSVWWSVASVFISVFGARMMQVYWP